MKRYIIQLAIYSVGLILLYGSGCQPTSSTTTPVSATPVGDGIYVVGTSAPSTTATAAYQLTSAAVSGKSSGSLYTKIVYLRATGNGFSFVKYKSNAIVTQYGIDANGVKDNTGGSGEVTGMYHTGGLVASASSPSQIKIKKDGLYLVYFDDSTSAPNFTAVPITDIDIIGPAVVGESSTDWNTAIKLIPPAIIYESSDDAWKATGVNLYKGDFQFRFNGGWAINSAHKKSDNKTSLYQMQSSLGTPDNTKDLSTMLSQAVITSTAGKNKTQNFKLTDSKKYDVVFTINPKDGTIKISLNASGTTAGGTGGGMTTGGSFLTKAGFKIVKGTDNNGSWSLSASTWLFTAPTASLSTSGDISIYRYTLTGITFAAGESFSIILNDISMNSAWADDGSKGVKWLGFSGVVFADQNKTSFEAGGNGSIKASVAMSTPSPCTIDVSYSTAAGAATKYTVTFGTPSSGGGTTTPTTFDPTKTAIRLVGTGANMGNWIAASSTLTLVAPMAATSVNGNVSTYRYTLSSVAISIEDQFNVVINPNTTTNSAWTNAGLTSLNIDVLNLTGGNASSFQGATTTTTGAVKSNATFITAPSCTLDVAFNSSTGASTYTLTIAGGVVATSYTFNLATTAFKLIGTTHLGDYVVANAPAFTAPASGTNNGDGTFSYTYTMGSTAFIQWKTFQILKNGTQYFGQTSSTTTFAGTSVIGGGVDATTAGSDATKNIKTYGNDNWQFSSANFTASSVTLTVKFTTATGLSTYTLTINN